MDTPDPITVKPATMSTARMTCEQIYNDYRYSSVSIVDLMVAAYDYAKIIGRAEAFQEALEINARTSPPKVDPHEDDERGILDLMADLKQACDHFDAIKDDRRAIAREVNGSLRAAR